MPPQHRWLLESFFRPNPAISLVIDPRLQRSAYRTYAIECLVRLRPPSGREWRRPTHLVFGMYKTEQEALEDIEWLRENVVGRHQ